MMFKPMHELCTETGTDPSDWKEDEADSPDEGSWVFVFHNIHNGQRAEVHYEGAYVRVKLER